MIISMIIAVIAAAMGGLIGGLRIPLLFLPLMFVTGIKNKKDIFLLVFFVYALAIGYEFAVSNLYELDLVKVLSVTVPTLLLLDSGLKLRSKEEEAEIKTLIFFIIAFVIGWFVREIFVAAVLIALIYEFSSDKARSGIFATLISFSLLLAAIVLGQNLLNFEGGAVTQVVFISAVSTLIALVFFWRKRDRVEFAPLPLVPVYR
ncbi:MAG: hypothetical protein J7K81_07945 [Methanophagales archaeon]|nr:hypothetical protein [Methanophagales archaeon]